MKPKLIKKGLSTRLTQEEFDKVQILQEKYCINISGLIRQAINDMYEKLSKIQEQK